MIICPWKDIKKYASLLPGIEEAFDAVNALTEFVPNTYPLSGENRYEVAVGTTQSVDLGEAHRKYIDVQCMIKGGEVVGWAPLAECQPAGEFNAQRDVGPYSGDFRFYEIPAGCCYVAFPEDVHMPARHLDVPHDYIKVVVKLAV